MKAIIAHGPAPVDAAVVLDALWPDAEGAAARASFDMAVMRLRKLLGGEDALMLDAGHIGFNPANVWVDAYAFAHGDSETYSGPLFGSDAVAPWWAAARERLHQRFLKRTHARGLQFEKAGTRPCVRRIHWPRTSTRGRFEATLRNTAQPTRFACSGAAGNNCPSCCLSHRLPSRSPSSLPSTRADAAGCR